MQMAETKLEPKQQAFCREYVIDFNGADAARRAGYSKKTAKEQATRLLTKVHIQTEIQQLVEKALKRNDITIDRVLKEIARLSFTDPRKFFSADGAIKNIHDLSDDEAASLSSIEIDELFEGFGRDKEQVGVTKKIKFWDKKGALELLGKYLGIFEKDNRQTTPALIMPTSVEALTFEQLLQIANAGNKPTDQPPSKHLG
jgi:phage terminase small subunit